MQQRKRNKPSVLMLSYILSVQPVLCDDVFTPSVCCMCHLLNSVITITDLDVIIKELHKFVLGSIRFIDKAKRMKQENPGHVLS